MATIPVLDHDGVLAAVSPAEAIERVRDGFVSFARGEWQMPPKVYLPSPPNGDFRAMPVRGEGLAILKWVTSFPGNPRRGLPTVTGIVLVSDADNGEPLAMLDARAVTALRTGRRGRGRHPGAGARGRAHRRPRRLRAARSVGRAAAWPTPSTGPGVCFDPDPDAAGARRRGARLGGRRPAPRRSRATSSARSPRAPRPWSTAAVAAPGPAPEPARRRRPRQGRGDGARRSQRVLAEGRLFCDEWEQASHGGELTGAVAAGVVAPRGRHGAGRGLRRARARAAARDGEITLFDSTGLAIQDLAIALGALEALRAGAVKAQTVTLAPARRRRSRPRASAGTPCCRARRRSRRARRRCAARGGTAPRSGSGWSRARCRPRARRAGCRPLPPPPCRWRPRRRGSARCASARAARSRP